MKAIELEKAYNPKDFEDRVYAAWESGGYFKPGKSVYGAKPFVVVIPPPNVTGVLHMGHGLNNSLQDIVVRYHRMKGEPTLWVPGTDHAGIATQNVVEKRLKKEGKSRHDLGREAFVKRTWEVKNEHHAIITNQLKKIGASVDWSHERFTLDEGCSRAVREVFVTLYERGLVYRGNYLVNWCTSCGTALADDEVEHEDTAGAMYHIWYELAAGVTLADGSNRIEIATTRPETLLGDTAVAVHPEDERYAALVGKMVKLPLTGREIPIVADSYVDKAFGTGMVKITPRARPERLGSCQAPEPSRHQHPQSRRNAQRGRARKIPRHEVPGCPQGSYRRPRGPRPFQGRKENHPRGRQVLPLQYHRRALSLRSVVRQDASARR